MRTLGLPRVVLGFCLLGAVLFTVLATLNAYAESDRHVPSSAVGVLSDSEVWRAVRQGVSGTVSIPDEKAAVLVQSEGDTWRGWRNGPIAVVGAVAFWVMFFVVFGFYGLRGKIRIAHGRSGRKVLRFTAFERFSHWLTAGSFIILAATGVNMLYGKHVVIPLIGKEAFATVTEIGKHVHNYVGFAFMIGLILIFVLWVRDNIWDRYDWGWIQKGGGLLFKTEHPKALKFNFGQKTMFWAVMIGGGILSVTGLNLLFPFVFADVNQMQWIQAIHGTVSQVLCMLMVAHIYIGTFGMENAFESMSTGYVDENWAKEHHGAWLEQMNRGGVGSPSREPALSPRAPGAPAE
jgi:formate dehydrogenase subunit gamma